MRHNAFRDSELISLERSPYRTVENERIPAAEADAAPASGAAAWQPAAPARGPAAHGREIGHATALLAFATAAVWGYFVDHAEVRRRDARVLVVYLRPFDEDRAATNETTSAGDVVYVYSMPTYRSLEVLNDIGAVVTVARLGFAARLGLYPADHRRQGGVHPRQCSRRRVSCRG